MASETRLIGAVGIKVRPVTKGFRQEIQEELRKLPDGEVKIEAKADTAKAKREIDKASEDRVVNLRIGPTHDELKKARQQLENELGKLKMKTIPIKLDKEGIKEALAKLDKLDKKSKVVMKMTEDKEGYEAVLAKIRAVQREKLVKSIKFKVDDNSLIKEAAKYERLIEEATKPREITITYSNDRDALRRSLDQVDAELAKMDSIEVPITADKATLAETRDAIEKMLADAPVKIKYTTDKAGYDSVLKKIAAIRAEKLALSVEINTDEASLTKLETEMQAKLKALQETAKIKIEVSSDTYKVRNAISQIDKALEKLGRIDVEVELDQEKLLAKRDELKKQLTDTSFEVTYTNDLESLRRAKAQVKAELDQADGNKHTLLVEANEESLEHTLGRIDHMIHEAEKKKAKIPVEAVGLKIAASQLAFASRARTVPFYVRINQKSLAVAEGVLKSLSGMNTLTSLGRTVERLVTNFDTILLKTAAVSTVVAGLVNGLTYAATAALAIGDGMSRAIGLTATFPAALTALTAGLLVNVAAWKNFKSGIEGNKDALAALPPLARDAANALHGTWTQIQKPIQANYWEAMGTSLQDMVLQILPQVRDGLANTATHVGRFGWIVANTIREISLTDALTNTLSNVSAMFDNAAGAARPLTEAISTLGQRGSEYLPQFGTWLADMAIRFNNFITEADEMGRINQWIEEGVQSLKDMWRAGDGIIDMFRGITAAALDAGANDLGTFADNMQRMGQIALSEPFKSRLSTVFEGARAGASALNVGVKDLGLAFGKSAAFIRDTLTLLGQLGGITLTNFSKLFSGQTFQGGINAALSGMLEMGRQLGPAFDNVGKVIGTLGNTAGAAFRGLAPLINTAAKALADVADAIGDELPDAAKALLSYMTGTFGSIAAVVAPLAKVLGTVLSAFNDMPDGIQRVVIAFLAFTMMRSQVASLFNALANKGPFKSLESSWRQQQMLAGNAHAATAKFNAGFAAMGMARDRVMGVGTALRDAGTHADGAKGKLQAMGRVSLGGLATGAKGLLSVLGGPWGIALAAAAVGLSLYAKKQQEAKAMVDQHTAAIEEQAGKLGEANVATIAKNLVSDESPKGIKSTAEALKALGKSVEDTAAIIVEGGPAFDSMIGDLDAGIEAGKKGASTWTQYGNEIKGNTADWEAWAAKHGIAVDAVNHMDLQAMRDQLVAERGALENSVKGWELRNDSVQTTAGMTEAMAASINVLGDSAADATKRLEAYRDILDAINGTSKSAWERQRELSASSSELAGFLGEVDEYGNRLNTGLIDLATGFTIHTEAGNKMGEMLDDLQSQQYTAAQAAYDMAGGQENAAAAAAAAAAATAPYRDRLAELQAQGLLSKDEVDALNRSLWGVPGSTPFELTDQNSAAYVEQKVKGLTETILATPNKQIEITEPLSPAVIKKLNDLGYTVRHLPNGNIQVTETGAATTGAKITGVAVEPRFSTITAVASTAQAKADLDAEANKPRTVSFFAKAMSSIGLYDGGILDGNLVQTFANGGIAKMLSTLNNVKAFAGGGVENHVAQIARPSQSTPIRIWAEPETQGEAYIPLAASKRSRSVSILNEVATQFGYNLSARHEKYADGGITHGGSTGGGVAVNIGSYITQQTDTPDDVARAFMRRIKAQGAYSPMEAF